MEYTLSDLATITGAKRRTIQLWAEGRVILTDDVHGGSGTYRKYSRQEAAIACLMVPFGRFLSIGQLAKIANMCRNLEGDVTWADMEEAIQGTKRIHFILSAWDGGERLDVWADDEGDDEKAAFEVGRYAIMNDMKPGALCFSLLVNTHLKALR